MSKFMHLRQAVFTRKLTAFSTYIRKKESPQINNLFPSQGTRQRKTK